ncbi:hypothetical protein RB594_008802 [Gaeumannomyces avenae]
MSAPALTETTGQVALVTAGSAGLGAAAARLFAANGMRVVVNYCHNKERAEALLAELLEISRRTWNRQPGDAGDNSSQQPPDFLLLRADLASRDQVRALVDDTVSAMGRLDAIFSNQGWTQIRDWTSLDDSAVEDDWDRCFNMNVKSHLWLLQAAKKHLEETEGCMVVTSSLAGIRPGGSSLAYSVTKAALNHLVKGLAVIAAPKIRVNAVCPGLMLTEWGLKFPQEIQDKNIAQTKLKRVVTPEVRLFLSLPSQCQCGPHTRPDNTSPLLGNGRASALFRQEQGSDGRECYHRCWVVTLMVMAWWDPESMAAMGTRGHQYCKQLSPVMMLFGGLGYCGRDGPLAMLHCLFLFLLQIATFLPRHYK